MKEKKHIDQLFKERFENFKASPSPHVWSNIQSKLKKEEKDRKVIPLWLKLGGVAALIALLLTIGNSVFNPSGTIDQDLTEENIDANTKEEIDKSIPIKEKMDEKIASENDNMIDEELKNDSSSDKNNRSIKKQNNIIGSKKVSAVDNKKSNKDKAIAINKNNDNLINENIIENKKDQITIDNETFIKKDTKISDVNKSEIVVSDDAKEEKIKEEDTSNKRSLIDVINEEKEKEAVVTVSNEPDNRWDITPNFAPVYYSSLGNGSSIDPTFSDNAKTGDVNFSYGVQVAYNITDRLSVRSGVSKVNLSYATKDIELGTGPVSAALKSVDYGNKQIVLTALDKGTLANQNDDSDPFSMIVPKSTSGDAEINQSLNYFEVPMELRYALINNRFGINLIGGFSTLLLGSNEISVKAGDFESVLGEANNLSSVSFTTNVGIGLNYQFSEKLMFNIEPMFKYQLNPYTDSSVDYSPYYIGIYSGLSFKF